MNAFLKTTVGTLESEWQSIHFFAIPGDMPTFPHGTFATLSFAAAQRSPKQVPQFSQRVVHEDEHQLMAPYDSNALEGVTTSPYPLTSFHAEYKVLIYKIQWMCQNFFW